MPTADAALELNAGENTSIVQIDKTTCDQRRIHVVVPGQSRPNEKISIEGIERVRPPRVKVAL